MAYDEELADRIRDIMPDPELVREQKMFGGLAFLRSGHMCCGVLKDELMLRLGPEGADAALDRPHVRQMDFTGRPMTGMVFVAPAGLEGDSLDELVKQAVAYARTFPPKAK